MFEDEDVDMQMEEARRLVATKLDKGDVDAAAGWW